MFANMSKMSYKSLISKETNPIVYAPLHPHSSVDIGPTESRFSEDDVALKKYKKIMETVPIKRGGRDRDVYLMDEEKVLKVAKSPEGLVQNIYEGDAYLEIVPGVFEKGADYAIVERANRNDARSRKFLQPMREYGYLVTDPRNLEDSNRLHKFQDTLRDIDGEYGTDTENVVANYTFAYGDFTAPRNWGWKEDMPKLIDPASLSVEATRKLTRNDPTVSEWRKILWDRRRARREAGLDDTFSIPPELEGTFDNPWGEDIAMLEERPLKELKYMRGIYGVKRGHKYIDSDSREFRDFKAHKRAEVGDDVFFMLPDEDIFDEFVKWKSKEMEFDDLTVLPPKVRYNAEKGYGYYAEIPFRHKPKHLKEEIEGIMQPFNVGSMSGEHRVKPKGDTREAWDEAANKYVDTMAHAIRQKKGTVPVVGITQRDLERGNIGEGRHRILAAERAGFETIPVAIELPEV